MASGRGLGGECIGIRGACAMGAGACGAGVGAIHAARRAGQADGLLAFLDLDLGEVDSSSRSMIFLDLAQIHAGLSLQRKGGLGPRARRRRGLRAAPAAPARLRVHTGTVGAEALTTPTARSLK